MEFLYDFFSGAGAVASAIGLIFALLNCFLGYKLMKLWIGAAGFIFGFILGCILCTALHAGNAGIYFLVGTVLGAGLAFVAFRFYKVGIFLLGALLGGSAALVLLPPAYLLLAAAVGLAVGILAVLAVEPVVVLSSAISGGLSAAHTAGALFGLTALTINADTIVLVGGIVLAAAGIVVQFIANKKTPETPVQA